MKDRKTYSKIILRCPNPLGDFVMSLPAAEQIRRGFPEAGLTLMMKPAYSPLISGMGWYDDILCYDKNVHGGMKGFIGAAGEIRRNGFDLAVLFTNSFGSALMMKLAGVGERVGYLRGGRGRLLTRGPRPVMSDGEIAPQPMVDYYGELCSFLGCGTPGRSPRLVMTEGEKEAGAEFLISRGIDPESSLLGLVPGAGYGTAKMWPPEYFAHAGDALAEMLSARPIIFAEAKDAALAGEIAGRMSHKPLDMSGGETALSGLGAMKQLMGRCSLVLTTDSGPRHVAAALGTPVVVVMGSADPVYSTTGQQQVSVQRVPVDCSPCMLRECPTDHRCMVRLKPEQVVDAAMELLGGVETRGGRAGES